MNRILLILSLLVILSCATKPISRYSQLKGNAQGTTFFISYHDSANQDFSSDIERILNDFDNQLSVYLPTSVISQFNANKIDSIYYSDSVKELFECFHKSIAVQEYTNGYFNHGLQNLIQANKLSSYSEGIFNKQIRDSILNINSEVIIHESVIVKKNKIVNESYIVKKDTLSKFNFNAIAQGQSVDVICAFFDSKGIENYMVEIGGEVRVKGISSKGKLWKVSLESPKSTLKDRRIQETIILNSESVVTSGSYRKFKLIDGVRYSHAVNPKTGLGVTHSLLSVSVITENCAIADGLATAFLVMGKEKSIEFLNKNNKYKVKLMFIESIGNEEYETSFYGGFQDYLN